MNTGNLIISRTNQIANKVRKIHLYVDGKKVYSISNDETANLELAEGTHSIYAKLDWCETAPMNVTIKAGEKKKLELGAVVNNWAMFDSMTISGLSFAGILLGKYWENDAMFWMSVVSLPLLMAIKYFTSAEKPLFYYLTAGRKEYLYLHEFQQKASYRIYCVS
jgi:hypothetical protein